MFEKISLSNKDINNLAKGIIYGTIIGIILGVLIGEVELVFVTCEVLGIIISLLYSWVNKRKKI
ncbi:MAG: hypothetical protein GX275_14905 [Clostridiales bacterium]|nr:hypothetical protein [Clostridiales bacterium]